MEFEIDVTASLEILVPKNVSVPEKLESFDGKLSKRGEMKFSINLLEKGQHDFSLAKQKIRDQIFELNILNELIGSNLWIIFKIYDSDFIQIFFDKEFLEFVSMHGIEINIENHS